jgi:hypothetical protein
MAEIAPFAGVVGEAKRDAQPALYRIHQTFTHHGRTLVRKGFLARVKLMPFSDGVILPYQPPGAAAAAGHALGLYGDRQHRIDELFEPLEKNRPDVENETQQMWRLTDEKTQAKVATIISPEKIYLAAGQGAYEALLAGRGQHPDDSAASWGAMYFCNLDDAGLAPVASHRVLHGLASFDRDDLLRRARDYFTVAEGPLSVPDAVRPALLGQAKKGPAFAMITPGLQKIAYLRIRGDLIKSSMPQLAESRALAELDLSHLHGLVFDELMKLDEAKHVRHLTDWDKAFAEVSAPGVNAVFLTNPVRFDLFCGVLDEGRVMPPHSVAIQPDPPLGITCPVDPAERVELPSLY